MKDILMKDDILKTAVKIARIIDDNTERDKSLSSIAQFQAAANRPDDALETIAHIRYVDIRADAIRKALDNLQTRFYSKKESMPQMDFWLEKLMDETMSIPESDVRCPKLNAINLLILSRLDDMEKIQTFLKQSRNEFAQLKMGRKRCKYLFAVYQMFQQIGADAEALATLELILEGISDYKPAIQQGLMIGMAANEFWKIQGRSSAIECIERFENETVKSYAYVQLVELLAVNGYFKEAQLFAQRLDNEDQKKSCEQFIEMGKSLIRNVSEMKGAVICLNKSMYFSNNRNKKDSKYPYQEKSHPIPRPVWFSLSVSIMPKDKDDSDSQDADIVEDNESSNDVDAAAHEPTNDANSPETDWDKFDWNGFDWDNVKTKNEELANLWNDNDFDDEEDWDESNDEEIEEWEESDDDEAESWKESDDDDDDDSEPWKESDEDESESWKESEDDEAEPWKESDDDEAEPWKESDSDDESSDNIDDKKKLINFLEMKQREFLRKFANSSISDSIQKIIMNRLRNNDDSSFDDAPGDKYFSMTEPIQGIVSFNRTLPPSLYQHFIRRLTLFFPIIKREVKERMTRQMKERIDDYASQQKEIGFDAAWQEVISQGDYHFAVECALNYFYSENKENLVFGFE